MDELLYTRIEDYLDNLLNPTEKAAFEADLKTDPSLAEAFALVQETRLRLKRMWDSEQKEDDLKRTLQAIGPAHFNQAGGTGTAKKFRIPAGWWAAAAGLALVLGWFVLRPPANERMYAQYRQFPEASFTQMGTEDVQNTLPAAAAEFNAQKYDKAQEMLSAYTGSHPENLEARFFLGLCWLEMKNYTQAAGVFENILSEKSAWNEEAQWYLALTYLRLGETDKCRSTLQLVQTGSSHYADAQQLLEDMK